MRYAMQDRILPSDAPRKGAKQAVSHMRTTRRMDGDHIAMRSVKQCQEQVQAQDKKQTDEICLP